MSASTGLMGSLKRLAGTLLAILHTRLELLSNEIQEELLRLAQMLLYGVLAVFFFCLTILMLMVFTVALFWDSYRFQVVGGLAALFFISGLVVSFALQRVVRAKSRLFSCSLAELSNDRDRFAPPP